MTPKNEMPRSPRDYGIAPGGFRLPDDTSLGPVRLQVSDLQRSVDYYEHVLGLRTLTRMGDAATLGVPGDGRPLVRLQQGRNVRPVPRRGAFGLYHFAILLPDRASLGRFAAHLGRIGASPGMADHQVSEAFYLADPDGLGIEVYADRPRNTWSRNDREIVMTVDPLDVRNLVAAAGGREWEGIPAGTTVGHVHLHVGDLKQAEEFYHSGLGFDKVAWTFPGALFLSAGGYHHHLGTNTWAPGPAAAEDQARLLEWELVVSDPEQASAAARSLTAAGYAVQKSGDTWTSADPWGTPLRIVSK